MDKANTYQQLIELAENTGSHKESRHLYNQATELMNSPKTVKPCRYPNSELQASIEKHQEKIERYQKYIKVSEALIVMCQDIIDSRDEVEGAWHAEAITATGWCARHHHLLQDYIRWEGNAFSVGIGDGQNNVLDYPGRSHQSWLPTEWKDDRRQLILYPY